MIPLTVSFFTKDAGSGKGKAKAVMYGFFIFMVYAGASLPFHFGSDSDILNKFATDPIVNVVFFAIFIFFAFSFFGFYELTLPSKWSNKLDSASNIGGFVGVFFMALTLCVVSFSCTGPILGSVLGSVLSDGPWPITAAMSGFGVALGLPFAIFAAFPSLMNKLPQSGGWLNSVKVVLGFVELALAFKFLSTAELVEHWDFLHRETFVAIWIIIAALLALYLFGKIKFPHDSPINKLSKYRLGFATAVLLFAMYLIPGLTNTSYAKILKPLSGILPPEQHSLYDHGECPLGLNCYHSLEEGVAAAKAANKPILLDFTGYGCTNCRRMEENVWAKDEVYPLINDQYVLISLYVDDREKLPEDQQRTEVLEYLDENGVTQQKKKKIRDIGGENAFFEMKYFKQAGQPHYVLLADDGTVLNHPVGYTPDVEEYKDFLECGLKNYQTHTNK